MAGVSLHVASGPRLTVLDDPARVAEFVPEWTDLAARVPGSSVLLTPQVLLSWWDAYGAGLLPHVVRRGGEAVAVLPLARRAGGSPAGATSTRIVPARWSISTTREAAGLLARHLAALGDWRTLHLCHLEENAPATRALLAGLGSEGVPLRVRRSLSSPWVDLPSTWEGLDARLSRSFRKSLRRKVNAGAPAGLTPEITGDPEALGVVLDIAADSWAAEAGTAISSTVQNRRFVSGIVHRAAGWLRIAILRDGGRPIAFELNLLRDREAVNLKVGYRRSAAGLSPGLVLRHAVIRDLIEAGASCFDLLGAAEPYKLHWTERIRDHVRLEAHPPTMAGRARHLIRDRIAPRLHRMLPSNP